MHDQLSEDDANATFVNEALADKQAAPEAVNRALDLKYGKKRAIFDATDPEANMNLVAEGYTLIKGGQLTGRAVGERQEARSDAAPERADQADEEGAVLPRRRRSLRAARSVDQAHARRRRLHDHVCRSCSTGRWRSRSSPTSRRAPRRASASWASCSTSAGSGTAFFNACEHGPTDELNQLILHELRARHARWLEPSRRSEYHEGLCKLGARFTRLAVKRPELFNWTGRPAGSFHIARKEDGQWIVEGPTLTKPIRFVRGQWAGGVSSEMHARNKAAELNGEPLPFPMELGGKVEP